MEHEIIRTLIERGALFVINHSAGKDSQAMTILLKQAVPAEQLVIVHAHLPEVEWEGSIEHIEKWSFGIPVHVCQAVKTFFQMVDHRRRFPDKSRRQCTSDLKRGPIEKQIRQILKERKLKLVVNCMGLRAEESSGRAKLERLKFNPRNSVAGREWYDWLPIHEMSTKRVFAVIRWAKQEPFWTYSKGMTRKSCCFCIMANKNDLKIAKILKPVLYEKYVSKEKELGHTLQMSGKPLTEITNGPLHDTYDTIVLQEV
jgi:3'-phosphoadenosine 5'-phosphosulfate sulfotransferase (PAPS reductase)/FAD synthetase